MRARDIKFIPDKNNGYPEGEYQYSPGLDGVNHPEGTYTGEFFYEDGTCWYMVNSPAGLFETADVPVLILDIANGGHYYRIEGA